MLSLFDPFEVVIEVLSLLKIMFYIPNLTKAIVKSQILTILYLNLH